MARWLFILTIALAGWFPPTAAQAITRTIPAESDALHRLGNRTQSYSPNYDNPAQPEYDSPVPGTMPCAVLNRESVTAIRHHPQQAPEIDQNSGRFWTMDTYQGDAEDPLSLHKYLYCGANPVDNEDSLGLFTQTFGYAAEPYIQAIYRQDHANDTVIYGKWARFGGLTGGLFRLKPDILNKSSKSWAEIKPFSPTGVAAAGIQYTKYSAFSVFGYLPDVGWKPSKNYAVVDGVPIIFWNCGGVIFYTDASEDAEDLFALATLTAAKQYMKENAAAFTTEEVLIPALVRITQMVRWVMPAIELEEI